MKEMVFFAASARHNSRMIGAFINGLGILLGALFGLGQTAPLSMRTQQFFKSALAAFTALYGVRLVLESTSGSFGNSLKQLALALIALVLGQLLGKVLALQTISNRCGRYAANLLAAAQKNPPGRAQDGLVAATILYTAAPLGLLGAITDGLSGYFYVLTIKAVMDGLAMMSFVKLFRWPVALAALPVFGFLNGLSLAVHEFILPALGSTDLVHSVNLAGGLIVCASVLVILEVRRVELANYLPALLIAPLLAHWLG